MYWKDPHHNCDAVMSLKDVSSTSSNLSHEDLRQL